MPISFLRGAKRLRWGEADRLLAVALRVYEDGICPGCQQRYTYAMNDALAEFWTTMDPVRDHACTALAEAADGVSEARHPHALRHVVGMRPGWEDALAASRKGAAADQ